MSQFLEVLEWNDPLPGEIVRRYPVEGSAEIKMGARCVVQEAQEAVFFKDGQSTDTLGPGSHTLSTSNLPIITKLLSLPFGFKSPFRTAVYFVNTRVVTELRWGTKNPVVFRDKELGIVRLRGYGIYTLSVMKPMLFVNTLMGARGTFNTDDISDYFCDVIVSRLNDLLGTTFTSILDLPAGYDELASKMKEACAADFSRYGVKLVDFFVNAVTPPDEVQKIMDERSGLGAVGNVDTFLKFQAARALGGAAQGGVAGQAAAGVGVGASLGAALPILMQTGQNGQATVFSAAGIAGAAAAGATAAGFCPNCGTARIPDGNFCAKCGNKFA